jgi:hypothetical protein
MGLFNFLRRTPRKKRCARCGQSAAHGYSQVAESDPGQITPLCVSCLITQLGDDYAAFFGRSIIVAPAAGFPCYVFRDRRCQSSNSPDTGREIDAMLSGIAVCAACTAKAHCAWIESRGLTSDNFRNLMQEGPRRTLLKWGNPSPASLCGNCTVERLIVSLRTEHLEYFEVCSPHGTSEGILAPQAY